jgi:uncharacterized protein (UPF0332 family)
VTTETQDLITLRLSQADGSLTEARLLATKEFGPSCDGNVAVKFQREFVKAGLIPAEIGDRFKLATQLHHEADLGAETPPDANRLRELLADADSFLTTTKLFLAKA